MLTTQVQNQPLATEFFTRALQSRSLAHAYVLKGQNTEAMYQMALDLAKILNCEAAEAPDQACGNCPSCKWVANNAHPAVLTISRLTYQVSDDGQDLSEEQAAKALSKSQPTQIKTEQIGRLQQQLGLSSPYYRVVIFTDVEEVPATMGPSTITPPYEWQVLREGKEISLHLRPLNRHVLSEKSANRFLKTLEEPPPKVLYFFLVDSEENLLETIVSRCQVVPFLATQTAAAAPDHEAFFSRFVSELEGTGDVFFLQHSFEEHLIKDAGYTHVQALDAFQAYLRARFLADPAPTHTRLRDYTRYQREIEQARKMIDAKTNPEHTLSTLFLKLTGTPA